eukprot:3477928-Pleurochrysis_carterae.AAC.1
MQGEEEWESGKMLWDAGVRKGRARVVRKVNVRMRVHLWVCVRGCEHACARACVGVLAWVCSRGCACVGVLAW